MRNLWTVSLTILGLTLAVACDDEADGGIEGTYQLEVFESRDTCDGVTNDFFVPLTVERDGEEVTLSFGDEWVLTGTFDNEGILQAQGTVEDLGGGQTTQLQLQIDFFRGGLEGNGRAIYNGTFPETGEPCQQDFTFRSRSKSGSLAPASPTGPASR